MLSGPIDPRSSAERREVLAPGTLVISSLYILSKDGGGRLGKLGHGGYGTFLLGRVQKMLIP